MLCRPLTLWDHLGIVGEVGGCLTWRVKVRICPLGSGEGKCYGVKQSVEVKELNFASKSGLESFPTVFGNEKGNVFGPRLGASEGWRVGSVLWWPVLWLGHSITSQP